MWAAILLLFNQFWLISKCGLKNDSLSTTLVSTEITILTAYDFAIKCGTDVHDDDRVMDPKPYMSVHSNLEFIQYMMQKLEVCNSESVRKLVLSVEEHANNWQQCCSWTQLRFLPLPFSCRVSQSLLALKFNKPNL